jgi:hypothetical protein
LPGSFIGVGANDFYNKQSTGDRGSGARLNTFEGRTGGIGPVLSRLVFSFKNGRGRSGMDWNMAENRSMHVPLWVRVWLLPCICGVIILVAASGCAHYPINPPLKQADPQAGYRASNLIDPANDDQLVLLLTFSGGGTRAAAFSYGVLEAFRDTAVSIHGRQRRLLDEVDYISGVSGGSFTAAYYGLFRDRIFEDFETRFLKKNIQGDITRATLFNPINWGKLFSAYYDRSDLAADYYNQHVFE